MKSVLMLLTAVSFANCMQSNSQEASHQQKKVGGPCEGCEAIYNSPIPFAKLNWVDTLPDFREKGPKLVISGTVYKSDGVRPAKDVVLYVYHTDQTGHYTNRDNEKGRAGRNGYCKGWLKTNERGQYKFYTLKPAPYPGSNIPAHIHPIVKEPDKNEYWLDEYQFEGDRFITPSVRASQEGRGGNGIIALTERGGILYGNRDLYLGRKIPDYPVGKN